jgi:hypothetical protein
MRLYAIVTSERLSRPARKGAEQELIITLSEGNQQVARIVQRPGEIDVIFADANGPRKITVNGHEVRALIKLKMA